MNQIVEGNDWLEIELARFLDDASLSIEGAPTLLLVMGGVAVGKTRFRRERFPHGYVVLDAGDIFIHLSKGEYFDFPSEHEDKMVAIGKELAFRALSEKHNIVCELTGGEYEPTQAVIKTVKSAGYEVEMQGLTCDLDVAMERNVARGKDNISAYYHR